MSTVSNSETNPDDTRQRIISAAMQLFGEVGYSQATTRAIAEAAGVNEVTLFRHFGTKKNLLTVCIDAFNTSSFAATFEAELTNNYLEDIAIMARLQIQNTADNIEMLRLLLCDARNVPELREAMLAGGRNNLAHLSGYFQRQIENGTVRPDIPADVLAIAFDNLFSTNVLFENIFQDRLSTRLPAEEITRPLVKLFVRATQAL